MELQVQNTVVFASLHLQTCLQDWDMDEELNLATTTDQYFQDEKISDVFHWHYTRIVRKNLCKKDELPIPLPMEKDGLHKESNVQSNLWLMVDPNLACPIGYPKVEQSTSFPVQPNPLSTATAAECPPQPSQVYPNTDDLDTDVSSSSELMFTEDEDTSSVDIPISRKVEANPKRKNPANEDLKKNPAKPLSKKMQCLLQSSGSRKGWPRPPINYCILIALALKNSKNDSLNVQQIYNFTREHFPFFQTAPDGWKNTIRHNLCFSNSFEKTSHFVSSGRNRKSCLWRLTPEGRRKLHEEIEAFPQEVLAIIQRSMNEPSTRDGGVVVCFLVGGNS
ncbi:forkhead box protein R1 [Latimeria chalumnae]|uniref:forkhead box protein R1 n=1 Tax=Latimeria chalumnae TaxID=7897 RepID=UPI00313AB507